uniref:Uncharacterized protein n=1 Tax=Oryza nivara TaxID=4536 RepID=A0A0E0GT72_ORYNI
MGRLNPVAFLAGWVTNATRAAPPPRLVIPLALRRNGGARPGAAAAGGGAAIADAARARGEARFYTHPYTGTFAAVNLEVIREGLSGTT